MEDGWRMDGGDKEFEVKWKFGSVQWAAAALLISVAPAPSRHRQTTPSPSDKQQLPIPIASRFPLATCSGDRRQKKERNGRYN